MRPFSRAAHRVGGKAGVQNENAEPKCSLRKAKTGAGPGRVQATVDVRFMEA